MTEKLVAGPLRGAQLHELEAKALAEFTAYFVQNYPGPDTVICKPEWHAPKIFRAAIYALREMLASLPSSPQGRPGHRSQEWLDGYAQACSEQGKSRAVPLNEEEVFTLLKGRFAIQGNKVAWLTDQLNKLLEVKRADAASPVQGCRRRIGPER